MLECPRHPRRKEQALPRCGRIFCPALERSGVSPCWSDQDAHKAALATRMRPLKSFSKRCFSSMSPRLFVFSASILEATREAWSNPEITTTYHTRAHKALPLYLVWRWDGDWTTERQLRAEAATWQLIETSNNATLHVKIRLIYCNCNYKYYII